MLCSYLLEFVVDSMDNVLEKIREVCGQSKTSTNTKDLKHVSNEPIVCWNEPNISKCDSTATQALHVQSFYNSGQDKSHVTCFDLMAKTLAWRQLMGKLFMRHLPSFSFSMNFFVVMQNN